MVRSDPTAVAQPIWNRREFDFGDYYRRQRIVPIRSPHYKYLADFFASYRRAPFAITVCRVSC